MQNDTKFLTYLMQHALEQAKLAFAKGEVPVGAVIAKAGNIIAAAHNEIEKRSDATAHAEILAIQEASKQIGDWRLSETILCVTLEPCPMCAGAIRFSRVGKVVFGALDPARGGFGSVVDLSTGTKLGPTPEIIQGIEAESSALLLRDFFKQARQG